MPLSEIVNTASMVSLHFHYTAAAVRQAPDTRVYENVIRLSDVGRDRFLAALENPPRPTDAALQASERFRRQYT
jgi:uncharacterized protein (DUF1778 family)